MQGESGLLPSGPSRREGLLNITLHTPRGHWASDIVVDVFRGQDSKVNVLLCFVYLTAASGSEGERKISQTTEAVY